MENELVQQLNLQRKAGDVHLPCHCFYCAFFVALEIVIICVLNEHSGLWCHQIPIIKQTSPGTDMNNSDSAHQVPWPIDSPSYSAVTQATKDRLLLLLGKINSFQIWDNRDNSELK